MIKPYTELKRLIEDDIKLFIIVGNDYYLINGCVKEIQDFHNEDETVRFDAAKFNADALREAFFTYPFYMQNRIVLIENFNPAKLNEAQAELLNSHLSSIPDFLIVILTNFVEGRFSVSRQYEKLADTVEHSLLISAEKPAGQQMYRTISQLASEEGVSISRDASELLLYLAGDDLLSVVQEIKKLAALCNYTKIEREHVERISVRSTESSVYDIISAIERRDTGTALSILQEMNDNRTEPIIISSALNTAFINLYRAKLIAQYKKLPKEMFDLFDYRKGDKKVDIAVNRASRYTKPQLKTILEILYQLDIDLKSSPIDSYILLQQASVEIAAARS